VIDAYDGFSIRTKSTKIVRAFAPIFRIFVGIEASPTGKLNDAPSKQIATEFPQSLGSSLSIGIIVIISDASLTS
jgi:hypothetical protein